MIAHASLHILYTHLAVGYYPERHVLCLRILAKRPRQVTAHVLEMIEESPGTRITEATTREIRLGISHLPREVGILAFIPALAACKSHHILGIHHIVLILHVELTDTTLVGMSTDGIIRNTLSHPYYSLTAGSLAHHLHDPSFVGIADSEGLTLRVVTIGISQCSHHLDSLAGSLGTLQGNIDKRSIIENTCRVNHLLATAIGSLANGNLPLIDITYYIIGLWSLWYFAMIFVGIPVEHLAHGSLGMLGSWIMTKVLEHTIIVSTVRTEHRTICRCLLAHNEIGAGICL